MVPCSSYDTQMDNLKIFLDSRIRKRVPADADDSWHLLIKTMDKFKEHDLHSFTDLVSKKSLIDAAGIQDMCTSSTEDICIEILHKISLRCEPPFALLPDKSLLITDAAIKTLTHIYALNNLSKQELAKALVNFKGFLPVQLLCKLQRVGLLQISTYVFKKFHPGNEQLLADAVLWLLTHSSDSAENVQMAMDVFASLLIANQSGPLNLQLSTICAANLKKCIESIVNWMLCCAEEEDPNASEIFLDLSYLSSPDQWSACGSDVMENFALTHLLHLLSEQTVPNTTEALLHAVKIQEKTSLENLSYSLRNLLKLIVKALEGEKIVHHLGAAAVKPLLNWRIIFLLTASLVTTYPDCCNDMRRLTDELIQHGFEGGRRFELSAGILLARQCCSSDSKNFSTYSAWFSSHFGADSVTARNTVQFQSLLQLLTDIVPAESPDNLRVHINKVPQAPTSCNSILRDYTALVRTRLADLNETSEMAGLFSDSRQDPIPGLDFRQGDIVKVLQHFQQTREIMKPVLEASIFRRSYYRNIFLVELLRLPGSSEEVFNPEDFNLDSEIRHAFISALKLMGKIPGKLFKAYTEQKSLKEFKEPQDAEITSKEVVVEMKCESLELSRKKRSLQLKR